MTTRREFLEAGAATATAGLPAARLDGVEIARRHAFTRTQATPDFFEGLLMGNGDVQVCLTVRPDALGLHLGKSDVWDLRVSDDHIRHLLPWPDFLRLWERAGAEAKRQGKPEMTHLENNVKEFAEYTAKLRSSYAKPWPRPWPCGTLWLHWDSRAVQVVGQRLDPSSGVAVVKLEHEKEQGQVRAVEIFCLVNQESGHVCLWSSQPAPVLSMAYVPHVESAAPLPAAELRASVSDGIGEFECFQELPAAAPSESNPKPGASADDSSFALCGRLGGSWLAAESAGLVRMTAAGADMLRLDLVLATPRDGADNRSRARREVARLSAETAGRLEELSKTWWRGFWAKSAVEIADPALERLWYQNQYLLACCLRPGKVAPGLFASWSYGRIGTAWHGDYHLNYNTQQVYWGVFSSNHVEQHLPYVELVEKLLPMAQWSAREMFGLPGAYFPHTAYPVPSRVNPYPTPPWGYEICETPWTVQSLWWHYQYTLDRAYLQRVYPLLKAAADFLMAFVKKGDDGRYHVIPSVSPENYGHTVDFRLNRDCIIDLALTEFLLDAMIEASRTLGVDGALRPKWDEVRQNLAAYPKAAGPHGEVWVDVLDAAPEYVYNVPVTLAPVFPAEQVRPGAADATLRLARNTTRTVRLEGGNDLVWQPLARARLGMLDLNWFKREVAYCLMPNGTAFDRVRQAGGRYRDSTDYDYMERMGVWIENLSLPAVLNECALQSVGGVIRLFPNTKNLPAMRFRQLRARGAFLVSASWNGKVVEAPVEILSEQGALCRVAKPWRRAALVFSARDGSSVPCKDDAGVLEFATRAGETYRLASRMGA